MEEERVTELLGRVGRVDPPPFLLTRIEARIAARQGSRPSPTWVFATSMAMLMLVAVNSYVLFSGKANTEVTVDQLVGGMNMGASNQLYHD
ncbi:MAG: hypothetical protein IPI81_07795 [Flavobacteriales bacterium]|nr:hypothetical protein [Flavobacteriales bacterium]MCC6938455.1 hypothetical protein [Flavobacteriales bacterium]